MLGAAIKHIYPDLDMESTVIVVSELDAFGSRIERIAKWLDARPQPTQSEIDAAVSAVQAKIAQEAVDAVVAETDRADMRSRVVAALARLDAIVTDGGTYTNVQVRAAVVDMAQMLRAMVRELRHRL